MADHDAAVEFVARLRDEATATLRRVREEMRRTGGRTKPIKTDIEISPGKSLATMAKVLAGVLALGSGIQLLANAGAALAPGVGLLAALPAVIAAGAVAMGTLKLATAGVGEAIGAGLSGDLKAFEKSLEDLPAPAAEFVRSVVKMRPEIDKLKKSVAGSFFRGMGDDIRKTAGTYLPMLNVGLGRVAKSMGNFGQSFLIAARHGTAFGGIRAVIDSTAIGIERARGGVSALTAGFAAAAGEMAPVVEDLGGGFASLTRQFGVFLGEAARSGQLRIWFDNAVVTLKQFGAVLGNIGSILGSVFSAANSAGGSFLQMLGDVTGRFAEFLESAEGMRALEAIFGAVAATGRALGTALSAVLPALGEALVALSPAIAPLADAIASVLVGLAPLLPVVGQLAALLAGALAGSLNAIVAALAPFIQQLSAALVPILPILAESLTALIAVIMPLAAAIGQALGEAMAKLAPVLLQVAMAFATSLAPELPRLTAAVQALIPPIVDLIEQMGTGLMQAVIALIPVMPQLVASGVELALAFAALFVQLAPLLPDLTRLAALVLSNRGGLLVLIGVMTQAAVIMRRLATGIDIGRAAFNAAKGAVWVFMGAIQSAGSAVARFVSSGVAALKAMPGKVANVGRDIVNGIVNGIRDGANAVMNAARDLAADAAGAIKRALKIASPSKVTAALGRWVAVGFAVGIRTSTKTVVSAAQHMTDELRKATARGTRGTSAGLLRRVQGQNRAMASLAYQREKVAKRITVAEKALADQVKTRNEYAAKIAEGARSYAALTTVEASRELTAEQALANMRSRVSEVQRFSGMIGQLRKSGLNATALDEIIAKGADGGMVYAEALARGGTAAISEANALQRQLDAAATQLGNTAADAMYGAGIKAAQGLVAGLRAQEKALAAQMARVAHLMAASIKRALGIHSPSRVMAEDVARYIPEGLAAGVLKYGGRAEAAAAKVAASMVRAASPQLPGVALSGTTSSVSTLRIEIVSPDGSVSDANVRTIAEAFARDPRASSALETALRGARHGRADRTMGASK